jgi:hypothetical protein
MHLFRSTLGALERPDALFSARRVIMGDLGGAGALRVAVVDLTAEEIGALPNRAPNISVFVEFALYLTNQKL